MRIIILLLISISCFAQSPRVITLNGVPVPLNVNGSYIIPSSGTAFTLTTTGTSGAATYTGGVLNIPVYSGAAAIDSFTWCTRLWRQKAIDSLLGVMAATYYPLSNPDAFISLTDISSSITGITYNNTTGVLSLTAGYYLPTTTDQSNWNTAYGNRIASFTTSGTSGSATFISNVLNIPGYTLAGLGGISNVVNVWGTIITSSNNIAVDSYLVASKARLDKVRDSITGIGYITGFTETDPIAIAKTATITNGWGVLGGGAAQTIGSNPAWTLKADSSMVSSWQYRRKGTDSIAAWSLLTFLTSYTETDPIATAKTETITNGYGMLGGGSAQTIGSNPAWTLRPDSSRFATWQYRRKGTDSIAALIPAPGTPNGAIQYDNSGLFSGATGAGIGNDGLMYFVTGIYTVGATLPSSGNVKAYGNNINGEDELWTANSNGVDLPLQTANGMHHWGLWTTNGVATQSLGRFTSQVGTNGTPTFHVAAYDASNIAPMLMYNNLAGAASPNTSVELRMSASGLDAFINNSQYGGGARLVIDCVLPSYVSTQRFFAGYVNTAGNMSSTTDPSTVLNTIGVGKDAADATLFFMFNNGSGTATKVNTGITPTVNDEYIITVTMPSNTTYSAVQIERRTKTASTKNSATNSAKIPAASTQMLWHVLSNSGGASVSPVLGIVQVYEELRGY